VVDASPSLSAKHDLDKVFCIRRQAKEFFAFGEDFHLQHSHLLTLPPLWSRILDPSAEISDANRETPGLPRLFG
jgi:hypothetical protein